MNNRIKKIRLDSNYTQQEFADKLKTSRNNIAGYELGNRKPSDAAINNICREFNVNEEWLRTGNGEPYIKLKTDNLIVTATSLLGRHDPLFESLIDVYSRLDEVDKEVLIKVIQDIAVTYSEKKKD